MIDPVPTARADRLPVLVGLAALAALLALAAPSGRAEAETPLRGPGAVARAIDGYVEARLAEEGVEPAPRADDAEFLRRLYLDVVGTVPTTAEVKAFLVDRSEDKRARKIDELLGSEAYADAWASWWHETLTGLSGVGNVPRNGQGGRYLTGDAGEAFRTWLHDRMAENAPYDRLVHDIVTATGRSDENGALGLYVRYEGQPNDLAGSVAKTFLGVRIQCAQCHDHPYVDEWKQTDFQGMAAFFVRTSMQRLPYDETDRAKRFLVEVDDQDGAVDDRRAERIRRRMQENPPENLPEPIRQRLALAGTTPKLWQAAEIPDVPGVTRRELLARWITAADNPHFAPALVNRYWAHFFGRGLVDPPDDFSPFNVPSHPEVLDLLARDFRDHGYDLKRLVRILVSTDAWQRTSRWRDGDRPDPALFAVAPVRSLTNEQLYFATLRATGLEERLGRLARIGGREQQRRLFAAFSFVFDDDEMTEAGSFEGSIPMGLFLMNGRLLNDAIAGGPATGRRRAAALGGVARILQAETTDAGRIDALWLAAYGREPDAQERQVAQRFVARASGTQGWEDLFWTLLASAEFMSNH